MPNAEKFRANLVVGLILFLTAFLAVAVIQSKNQQSPYQNLRREELLELLNNANAEAAGLEDEIRDLEATRDELSTGAAGALAAEEETKRRMAQLEILAGTVPATGPGIIMTINAPPGKLTGELLLDAVEELRDAGAEVIDFNSQVRVVANTWFAMDEQGRILVDSQVLQTPIVITAIGDPPTLEAATRFRGGLISEIESQQVGGRVSVEQRDKITISTTREPVQPRFARPR